MPQTQQPEAQIVIVTIRDDSPFIYSVRQHKGARDTTLSCNNAPD